MKNFYLRSLSVLVGIVFFQDSLGQNLVPLVKNTFDLGSVTRNWKTLYVNNVDASGNITAGGTLGVTGISSLGGLQIKGPTTFIGFGSGVLSTNASGVVSSGPLTAAQIPLLPYLPLSGGTLTGPLNGSTANFTTAVTGPTAAPGDNSTKLATTSFVNSVISVLPGFTGTFTGPVTVGTNANIGGNITVGGSSSFTGPLTGTTGNFTSVITGPTAPAGDNSNNLATTAFVNTAISSIGTASGAWGLTGNSGTVDGTNFIGTTDNVPLNFRINNRAAGRIDFLGSVFFGLGIGQSNGGINNIAFGLDAFAANINGGDNVAIGTHALYQNLGGSQNVALGSYALGNNKSGLQLTAIGYAADVNADGYSNSTAIGSYAKITASNIIQLGNDAVTKVYAGTSTNATLIAGGLQITGGSQAIGNVLTSDANGVATWQLPGANTSWGLTGNSGTVDGTNFIGTTDNVPLNFRINNRAAGRIDFLGSVFFGLGIGQSNGGINNIAFGLDAFAANINGGDNVAIGTHALYQNLGGSQNVALGSYALGNNKSGLQLTAIGYAADVNADGYSNSTAIGSYAKITASNIIQLGNDAVTKVYAGTSTNATLIAGGLQITGGSQAIGNVLTSDANGVATWQAPITGSGANSWSLIGNSGTVDGTNFIGTTDATPLNFKVNNIPAGRIDWNINSGNTFFGFGTGQSITPTLNNSLNNGIGGGTNNSGLGFGALSTNTTGAINVAIGTDALLFNSTGSGNVGIGAGVLSKNKSGNGLTAIGYQADVNADGYTNSSALGWGAIITANNIIQLGNGQVTKVYAGTGTNATLVAGGLQITGGTLAAGNVLTSDASGNATWQPLAGSSTNAWNLTGNSGTVDVTNFVGTTDAVPLNFKVNNIPSGRIDWNNSSGNTFFGFGTGQSITPTLNNSLNNGLGGGTNNSGLGYGALSSNTSGAINVAIGTDALLFNSTGSGNVGIGAGVLSNNKSGNQLTAIGYQADVNADGYINSTALGYAAIITANNIIQLGNGAVTKVFAGTGTNATLVAGSLQITGGTLATGNVLTSDVNGNATWQPLAGSSANSWSLTGNSGTIDGTNFLGTTDKTPINFEINNTPAGRIDFSHNALFGLSTGGADGTYNTSIGDRALNDNNGGNFNTAIGASSLVSNRNGVDNVAVGYFALDGNSGGNGNVGIGVSTLQENSTGSNLTALGNYVDVSMDGFSNSTAIGWGANIDGSNEVILGNNLITSIKAQVNGITTLSDGRFKKNINENVPGLEFIKLLRPVTYNYNIKGLQAYRTPNNQSSKGPGGTGTAQPQTKDENAIVQKEKILYTGLVAQDVEAAAKKIKYNFSGLYIPQNSKDTYGLSYVDFVVPLIKAVQQLTASNDSLQNQITDLQNQLNEIRAQVASLASLGTINKENVTTTSIQLSSARLEQNAPNPFNQSTQISYYVPQTAGNAMIMVTDINGKNIKTIQLGAMGSGQISLQTSQLMSGTYTYSLYVDGNLIDTKDDFGEVIALSGYYSNAVDIRLTSP